MTRSRAARRAPAAARLVPMDRATLAVAAALLATGLLHLAAPALPEGWMWSVRALEWLPMGIGAGLLVFALVLSLPVVGGRLAAIEGALGDGVARVPWLAGALLGAVLAVLVLGLADESQFTGDFLLRVGLVREGESAAVYTPQSLPLDVAVNTNLARALAGTLEGEAGPGRALGAVWALALGFAGAALARASGMRGAAALVVAVLAACGGALGLCTGYPKAFGPIAVLAVFAVAFALRAARGGSAWPLALVTGAALLWHRSALVLVPLWFVGALLATRARAGGAAAQVASWLVPPLAFAVSAAQTVRTLTGYDATRHVTASPFGGLALADRVGVVLTFAPLALVAGVAAIVVRPVVRSARMAVALAAAVPALALLLAVSPQQGVPRDWDVYAVAGGVCAALVALAVGRAVAARPAGPRLAAGLATMAFVLALQPLAVQHVPARGEARARAIAQGPPLRAENERGLLWDYLGIRAANALDMRAAGDAWGEAAAVAPSPRMLFQWGWAELSVPRPDRAEQAFRQMLARDSTSRRAWLGLFAIATGRRDVPGARVALERAIALAPDDSSNATLRATLDQLEARVAAGAPR